MKRVISVTIFFILGIANNSLWGQVSPWSKNDRDNIFNDCMSYLGSNYKNLKLEEKETISLCFLDQITAKFNKEQYQSKIEIEIKRLRSATIGECAKTHGIELNIPSEPVVPKIQQHELPKIQQNDSPKVQKNDAPTKENLVGHWKEKNEDREFELSSMGTFTMVYEGKRSNGKWQLNGMKLTLFFDRLFGAKEREYQIEIFKEDNFVYTSSKGSFYNVIKIK